VVRGFDRPNIALQAVTYTSEEDKRADFVLRVAAEPKPGIVYAATRSRAEELAAELGAVGLGARVYHGGLRAADREQVHQAFSNDECDVVVATTAFGMGIDKANVRFVVHYDVADSLDSYYQEIGRAGRDGQPAAATLLYRPEDVGVRTVLRRSAAAGQACAEGRHPAATRTRTRLADRTEEGIRAHRPHAQPGRRHPGVRQASYTSAATGELVYADAAMGQAEVIAASVAVVKGRDRLQQSRVEMMQAYAETRGCRRQPLLSYFGEPPGDPCGNCDNCAEGGRQRRRSTSPYPLASRVDHLAWGPGLVMRYEEDTVVVLFEQVGYKTLSLDAVAARSLLARSADVRRRRGRRWSGRPGRRDLAGSGTGAARCWSTAATTAMPGSRRATAISAVTG
jgi:ATP-dependent DNA helicase RecQ